MGEGPVTYRNRVTGREVETEGPDEELDRSRRWERLGADGEPAAAEITGEQAGAVEAVEVEMPGGNASAEEWRAYAVAAGMDEETAAGLSRNELREHFAG